MSGERRCAATLPIPCPSWTPTEEDAHCTEHIGYKTFWKEKAKQLSADWIASPEAKKVTTTVVERMDRLGPLRGLEATVRQTAKHVRAYEAFLARWLEANFAAKRSPK